MLERSRYVKGNKVILDKKSRAPLSARLLMLPEVLSLEPHLLLLVGFALAFGFLYFLPNEGQSQASFSQC